MKNGIKTKVIFVLIGVAGLMAGILAFRSLYGILYINSVNSARMEKPVPEIDTDANQNFMENYVDANSVNDGLSIVEGVSISKENMGNDTRNEDLITFFIVQNLSQEKIRFSDQGFNLSIYTLQNETSEWNSINLVHEPYNEVKVLPPDIKSLSSDVGNAWEITYSDVVGINPGDPIRIYIQGIGLDSGKIYGAYYDLYAP